MKKRAGDIFMATNPLRVLAFLSAYSDREFFGSEIQNSLKLSRMGVYLSLCVLVKEKLILRFKKGKFLTYAVNRSHPVVRQFKVLRYMVELFPLVERLRENSKKVVLYGSVSRGEDTSDSDLDLFVLTADPEVAGQRIPGRWAGRKVQAVIKTPTDWIEFKDKEPVFYDEVNRGIVLWEVQE
jgi:predicted nucleotidyltransferase